VGASACADAVSIRRPEGPPKLLVLAREPRLLLPPTGAPARVPLGYTRLPGCGAIEADMPCEAGVVL